MSQLSPRRRYPQTRLYQVGIAIVRIASYLRFGERGNNEERSEGGKSIHDYGERKGYGGEQRSDQCRDRPDHLNDGQISPQDLSKFVFFPQLLQGIIQKRAVGA